MHNGVLKFTSASRAICKLLQDGNYAAFKVGRCTEKGENAFALSQENVGHSKQKSHTNLISSAICSVNFTEALCTLYFD